MAESSPRPELASPEVATLPVLLIVASGLVFLAATMVGLAFVYAAYGPSRALAPPQAFPRPQLQPDDSPTELNQLLAAQRKRLDRYGWANTEHTLVNIPIARAADIIARRGARAYDPIVPPEAKP
jgi:hypothetical protein